MLAGELMIILYTDRTHLRQPILFMNERYSFLMWVELILISDHVEMKDLC